MMNKTLLIMLFTTVMTSMSSTSWANRLTTQAQNNLAQQNLIGLWHCEGNSKTVKYNSFVEFNNNLNYKENGTTQFYLNGKWLSVPYKGQGQWALQAQKYLKITRYLSSMIKEPDVAPESLETLQNNLNQSDFHLSEILRSNGKILVLQYKTSLNQTATLRCNKKRA